MIFLCNCLTKCAWMNDGKVIFNFATTWSIVTICFHSCLYRWENGWQNYPIHRIRMASKKTIQSQMQIYIYLYSNHRIHSENCLYVPNLLRIDIYIYLYIHSSHSFRSIYIRFAGTQHKTKHILFPSVRSFHLFRHTPQLNPVYRAKLAVSRSQASL